MIPSVSLLSPVLTLRCRSIAKVFQFRVVICSVSLAWRLLLHGCIWRPKEYSHNSWQGWKVMFDQMTKCTFLLGVDDSYFIYLTCCRFSLMNGSIFSCEFGLTYIVLKIAYNQNLTERVFYLYVCGVGGGCLSLKIMLVQILHLISNDIHSTVCTLIVLLLNWHYEERSCHEQENSKFAISHLYSPKALLLLINASNIPDLTSGC